LKFELLEPADYLVLADLIYGDGDAAALKRFLTKRRKHMGILQGTVLFLRWSACEPFRAFHYLIAHIKQSIAARRSAAGAQSTARIARPIVPIAGPADSAAEAFAAPLVAAPSISPEPSPTDPDVTINPCRGVVVPSILSFDRANALYVPRT
jgi:cellulose synthase (UDP-forming)